MESVLVRVSREIDREIDRERKTERERQREVREGESMSEREKRQQLTYEPSVPN